jgi:hypothetical protein
MTAEKAPIRSYTLAKHSSSPGPPPICSCHLHLGYTRSAKSAALSVDLISNGLSNPPPK